MARLTLKLLKIEPPFVIAIDRTEWQFGKRWVNVLMLSVAYKKISLPLFWTVLQEKGCSDNAERRTILQQFIDEFGIEWIGFVTADREFASKQWLKYLVEEKINFRRRIKANAQITDKRGKLICASKLWRTLKVGARMECRRRRKFWNTGRSIVAVCRKEDGEAVIVVSSERSGQILKEYGARWQIETLFANLKTRGFRLDDRHSTDGASGAQIIIVIDAGRLSGVVGRRTCQPGNADQNKETRQSGKEHFPLGL